MTRSIALVDCNNFFVSCERVFRPDLRDKPVVVLSSNDGCAIARSNEAKALGIKMGEPWFKVRDIPAYRDVVVFSSNFPLYADMSNRVMAFLSRFSPAQEVYSVDESFLDLTGFQDIRERAYTIRAEALRRLGMPVCVGIGPTKTLAKLANFVAKKHPASKGVFNYNDLSPEMQDRLLSHIPIDEVWGIGRKLNTALLDLGIENVLQLRDADISTMRSRYGVTMERLMSELRGVVSIEMTDVDPPKKQILSSRSFGIPIKHIADLENAIAFHVTKVTRQLRDQRSVASMVHVFLMTSRFRDDRQQYHPHLTVPLTVPSNCAVEINRQAMLALHRIYRDGFEYKKAGMSVSELTDEGQRQLDIFASQENTKLMQVMDEVNDRFGNGTIRLSQDDILHRNWGPRKNRISPRYTTSWDELAVCR